MVHQTFTSSDCQGKVYCADCCESAHKHPSHSSHNPVPFTSASVSTNEYSDLNSNQLSSPSLAESTNDCTDTSGSTDPWDDDITDSPNTSQAFMEASMIMTLAERFNLTQFRQYQKEAITALLSGQDCLVIQPTGSGTEKG